MSYYLHRIHSIGLSLWLALCLGMVIAACKPLPTPSSVQRPASDSAQDTRLLRVATCWEAYPLAEQLSLAFEDENQAMSVEIIPGPSDATLQLLSEGQVDLALVTEPAKQTQSAPPEGQEALSRETLAITTLAVIVHRDNPLVQITTADLQSLYTGYVVDWSVLGETNGTPVVIARQSEATVRRVFDQIVLQTQELSSAALLLPHEDSIVDYVGQNRLAVGYVTWGAIDERVHAIRIDGVSPSLASIHDTTYPLILSLDLLSPDSVSAEARLWIAFTRTRDGREIIQREHLLPD